MREVTAGHEVENEVGGTILTWGRSFNEPGHGGSKARLDLLFLHVRVSLSISVTCRDLEQRL